MLVTLGSGASITAGSTQTFQYACNSVQQIFIRCEESGGGNIENGFITVQIGNDVVVNDISMYAMALLSTATGGGAHAEANAGLKIDLGSHILAGEENLYVRIRNSAASAALDALDVSAIVNEGGVYQPVRYTAYADKVFTDTNTLAIYAWCNSDLDEDDSVFTVRNQSYSSAPQVLSGSSVTQCTSWAHSSNDHGVWLKLATMAKNQVPLNTSVNYTSTIVDGVICVSAMDRTPAKAQASRLAGQAVFNSMTAAERKAV